MAKFTQENLNAAKKLQSFVDKKVSSAQDHYEKLSQFCGNYEPLVPEALDFYRRYYIIVTQIVFWFYKFRNAIFF